MKTILITGINGFLGSHLAKALKDSYNIIGLEYSLENLHRIEDCGFNVYSSDTNLESLFKENQIFAVIHTATVYRRNNSIPLKALINTNILLPVELYELAEDYGSILYVNTDTFFNSPDYNYSYLNDYTLSKKQILEWLKIITNRCKLINMKIFHMYGPGDAPNKFVPQMITALKSNVPFLDLTEGEQTRDFIYINDIVNAFEVILEKHVLITKNYTEFQVGSGKAMSIKEFLFILKEFTKSRTQLNFGKLPYRKNEIMTSVADTSNLTALGWNPKFKIKDGVQILLKDSN